MVRYIMFFVGYETHHILPTCEIRGCLLFQVTLCSTIVITVLYGKRDALTYYITSTLITIIMIDGCGEMSFYRFISATTDPNLETIFIDKNF